MRRLFPSPGDVCGPAELEEHYFPPVGKHLRCNFVVSLDGAVEIGAKSGPLGGDADHAAFMAMRAVADVILVGAGTVRQEKYGPIRLPEEVQGRRVERGQSTLPPLAIVSRHCNIDPAARVWQGNVKPLLLTTAVAAWTNGQLSEVAEVIAVGENEVDLQLATDELASRGLSRVLCEGGPTLTGSLLDAGLVDEMCLTFSPYLAGPGHLGLLGATPLEAARRLELESVLEGDGMLLARYAGIRVVEGMQ